MKLQLGLNKIGNTEYHADNEYLSSSNLKMLLKDPSQFHKEKILGQKEEKKESSSFVEGSLTHSLILEPHLVQSEYAFFEGMRKQGKDFEDFVAANPGKPIISKAQQIRCKEYKKAYDKNRIAVGLVQGGEAEQTICQELSGVPIKVRCDYINVSAGYIADVKTSSMPVDVDSVRMTINQWGYGLSAALYAQVASQYYSKPFDFYFLFISKSELVCSVYKASEATINRGLAEVAKAISVYKNCKSSGVWALDVQERAPILDIEEILEV